VGGKNLKPLKPKATEVTEKKAEAMWVVLHSSASRVLFSALSVTSVAEKIPISWTN